MNIIATTLKWGWLKINNIAQSEPRWKQSKVDPPSSGISSLLLFGCECVGVIDYVFFFAVSIFRSNTYFWSNNFWNFTIISFRRFLRKLRINTARWRCLSLSCLYAFNFFKPTGVSLRSMASISRSVLGDTPNCSAISSCDRLNWRLLPVLLYWLSPCFLPHNATYSVAIFLCFASSFFVRPKFAKHYRPKYILCVLLRRSNRSDTIATKIEK